MGKTIATLLLIYLSGFFLYACTHPEKPEEKTGVIVMEPATRGSYQYLIKIDKDLFWPENLPKQYKIPELEIRVKFIKTGALKDIYKPAPNDVPIKVYAVPIIRIVEINELSS